MKTKLIKHHDINIHEHGVSCIYLGKHCEAIEKTYINAIGKVCIYWACPECGDLIKTKDICNVNIAMYRPELFNFLTGKYTGHNPDEVKNCKDNFLHCADYQINDFNAQNCESIIIKTKRPVEISFHKGNKLVKGLVNPLTKKFYIRIIDADALEEIGIEFKDIEDDEGEQMKTQNRS
jgi:hypothetical protein